MASPTTDCIKIRDDGSGSGGSKHSPKPQSPKSKSIIKPNQGSNNLDKEFDQVMSFLTPSADFFAPEEYKTPPSSKNYTMPSLIRIRTPSTINLNSSHRRKLIFDDVAADEKEEPRKAAFDDEIAKIEAAVKRLDFEDIEGKNLGGISDFLPQNFDETVITKLDFDAGESEDSLAQDNLPSNSLNSAIENCESIGNVSTASSVENDSAANGSIFPILNPRSEKYFKLVGKNYENSVSQKKASDISLSNETFAILPTFGKFNLFRRCQPLKPKRQPNSPYQPISELNKKFINSVRYYPTNSGKFKPKITVPNGPKLLTMDRARKERTNPVPDEVFTGFKSRPMPNFAQLHARNQKWMEMQKETNLE